MNRCEWPISFDERGDAVSCGKEGKYSPHQGGHFYCPHHFALQEESVAQMQAQRNRVKSKNTRAFIVVEGPDGVGKTRTTAWIAKRLRKAGLSVVSTREPSDGSIGRRIREMLRGEVPAKDAIGMSRLYAEDRIDHLASVVLPNLRGDEIVVCDRYLLSSIAYQHGAMGLALSDVLGFNRYAVVPDLTIILRASQDVCTARRAERGEVPSMFEDEETQRKIRRVYDNASDFVESHNPVFVDASGTFDETLEACMGHVMSTIEEVSK